MLPSDRRKIDAGYVQVPFCAFALTDEAVDRLRLAGVTGEIEVVTLEPKRAWLGGAAGRVTMTRPSEGELVAPGAPVSVYVNPGQPSDLSERDLKLIEEIKQNRRRRVDEREQIFVDSPAPRRNSQHAPQANLRLTTNLLERLNRRLTDAGAILAARWRPGLSDEQIDDWLLPVGINLPEEARIWWRWHNGQEVTPEGKVHTLAGRQFMAVEAAVDWYEKFRGINHGAYGLDGLIPVLIEQPTIWVDCSRGFDDPVPVYTIGHGEEPVLVLGSLGDLVAGMLELLESGAWLVAADGYVRRNHDQDQPTRLRFL